MLLRREHLARIKKRVRTRIASRLSLVEGVDTLDAPFYVVVIR